MDNKRKKDLNNGIKKDDYESEDNYKIFSHKKCEYFPCH